MKCERCGGLTINAFFSGGITAIDGWEYAGLKCLNCGYITDPLILENRVAQYQHTNPRTLLRTRVGGLKPALR